WPWSRSTPLAHAIWRPRHDLRVAGVQEAHELGIGLPGGLEGGPGGPAGERHVRRPFLPLRDERSDLRTRGTPGVEVVVGPGWQAVREEEDDATRREREHRFVRG